MLKFNEMVYKYTIKPSNKIKNICEPLHKCFGVKHFWYSRTTKDGGYFSLASNPEMHDYYHSTKQHLHSPFFRNPELIKPGFYSYRNIHDKHFQDSLNRCASLVNIELGACIVIRQKNDLIRFGYATSPENSLIFNDLITDNLFLLKKFNEYFLKEMEDILGTVNDDLVDLPSEMGQAFNILPKGMKASFTLNEKCKFLEKLGLINLSNLKQLTCREIVCLKLVKDGLSGSQISLSLNISRRTVEQYIEILKFKLDCNSKGDLIKKSHLLEMAGYFD